MSTKTVRRPQEKQSPQPPEWRRICHRFDGESQISMCGAARRRPDKDLHWDDECAARGHGMCVVCEELLANERTVK